MTRENTYRPDEPSKRHCRACRLIRQKVTSRTKRYRMSERHYEAMKEAQGGACFICRKLGALCVDHDHVSGAVRALLCKRCNTMLGIVEDEAFQHKAKLYLQHFRRRSP